MSEELVCLTFENNKLLSPLFGKDDQHLYHIEKTLHVSTASRGNMLSISGKSNDVLRAKSALESLYHRLEKGREISLHDVDAAIRMSVKPPSTNSTSLIPQQEFTIATRKKNIVPYTHIQLEYMHTLHEKELVFASGPAGTGKTYIAVAMAVSMFINKHVDRII
ncbi:MAG: PhoH family protein, partial [Burkholderiales bacterium]